jgi:hypothetical protein
MDPQELIPRLMIVGSILYLAFCIGRQLWRERQSK